MKRLIAFFSFCFIISFLTNCDEEKEIFSQRNHILNLVYQEYEESYNDSIAVFESSLGDDVDRYMKMTSFDTTTISNRDIQRWNNQHKNYKRIDWQEWGWNDIPLISEEEFPDYFEYNIPPPDAEITNYITVLYFSIPFVGKENALLFVAKKSGKYSWNVDRIILKKTGKEWKIHSKMNIITT